MAENPLHRPRKASRALRSHLRSVANAAEHGAEERLSMTISSLANSDGAEDGRVVTDVKTTNSAL